MDLFLCDYGEGCHPNILKVLERTNLEQTHGYGMDPHCDHARALIKEACQAPEADVHFLVGGTQTNTTVIASILRPHQGALCADSGHINVHETGAIESTGHKVLPLPAENGKLSADTIEKAIAAHRKDESFEHIVQPGLVYISHPTEYGTLYTRAELEAISGVCRSAGVPLFVDGARLGYGLAADGTDVTLPVLAELADVFYIGGTKVGALFGEAVVITNPAWKQDFRYLIKQRGGMLAKGRLLGVQFEALFENGLYYEMGRHANEAAAVIRQACKQKGYPVLCPSPTPQHCPILPDEKLPALAKKYAFAHFGKVDDSHSAIRFCTSWATKLEDAQALAQDLLEL